MFSIDNVHPFHQLLISITLGLFVGLQRQWADTPLGGVRTFSLVSLLGTVTGFLSQKYGPAPLGIGALGVIVSLCIGNFRYRENQQHSKFGLSTEISMMLMFMIGAILVSYPIWIGIFSAGAIVVILQSKLELHEFATRFSAKELKSIMQFALLSLVIFPLVPNASIDPLGVINPHDVWLMVILVVGLGLAGYIVYKFFGNNAGTFLSGILGGVISSTATSVNYARRSMEFPASLNSNATIISIAWTTVYVRLMMEIAIVSPKFRVVFIPLSILFIISTLSSFYLWKNGRQGKTEMPLQENPSEIKVGLFFGLIYSAVIFAVAYAKRSWGNEALYVVSFLSGITDVDAITLSTANLVHDEKIGPQIGSKIIILALASNTLFKGLIALGLGGKKLFFKLLGPLLVTLLVGILLWFYI